MKELVEALWLMSIQSGILIFVVLLVRFALRNYKKMYSYCLWLLVLVRLLCPVFIESNWSLQPDVQIALEAENLMENQNIPQENSSQVNHVLQPATPVINTNEADNVANESESTTEIKRENRNIASYLQVIYLVGVTGFVIYFSVQYFMMKRKVAFAIRDKENVWLCEQIASPFVMGVIKPRIYLPLHISDNEKRHILRHEQAHIAHMDPLVRMLGSTALILHWWNPMVWYAIHKMNQDMEMFCDETALANAPMAERKAYSNALLHFSVKQSGLAITLSFGESNTEVRIKNVLRRKRTSILIGMVVLLTAIVCGIAFLTIPKDEAEDGNLTDTEALENTEEANSEEASELPEVTNRDEMEIDIYGDWLVYHVSDLNGISALSTGELWSFNNMRIGYTEDFCRYYDYLGRFFESVSVVQYHSEYVTKEEFEEEFPGRSFDDLAIEVDGMQSVSVEFEDNTNRFGAHFYVYDESEIIIFYEDAFFWAQKMNDLDIIAHEGQLHYKDVTNLSRSEVESFANEIKSQILNRDWMGISEKISYPITIAGTTYQNAEAFLAADMNQMIPEEFIQIIEQETCEYMFCNWQGIMMGETGEIWLAEVLNDESESQGLKIIAINLPENSTITYESEPWYAAYQTILDDWTVIDAYGDFSYLKMYFDDDYSFDNYYLCDVNSNGVPELFLHSDYMNITAVFTYYDNQIQFLTYDNFYGINKETSELIIYGHWHGAGGSGENEWTAYQVTNNRAIYSLYIDYFDIEGLEKSYTIYTLDNQEYEKQTTADEYNELYAVHIEPCISIRNYKHYDLEDVSGLNVIQ